MRNRITFLIALSVMLGLGFAVRPAQAITNAERYAGYILLQYQQRGQTWYVDPLTKQRYYNGSPRQALRLMQHFALGITNADLAKIPVAGSSLTGDVALRQRLSGRFLLAVQDHGKIWYVWPKTRQRYLIDSSTAAFWVMGHLSIGVTDATLATIPVAAGFGAPTAPVSGLMYNVPQVATSRGTFITDIVSFDRAQTAYKIKTDTGQNADCSNNCTTYPLLSYITRRVGLAGIHGTYFCPPDYASCAGQTGSYLYPVYNSYTRVMINNGRIKYTTQPMIAIDSANAPHYYHQAIDFVNQATFESSVGLTLQAAISNGPALVENGQNVVSQTPLDNKQATVKSFRGAFGWKGTTYYLIVVHDATVTDSAAVVTALGLDYAINLDGGGSTALYTNGRYMLGPGRSLPNAIVVTN